MNVQTTTLPFGSSGSGIQWVMCWIAVSPKDRCHFLRRRKFGNLYWNEGEVQRHIDNRRFFLDADVRVNRILENLVNVRRMEGIIDYYRVNGAPSGEIALAIVEFVKRGDEGLSMEAE